MGDPTDHIIRNRLNWFGFFTSSELLAESRNDGDGFVANLGFRDQRLGFQWVQQQIAGFGGDSTNITAFGESGGSISLTHHLCANEPLFQRVILQSGTVESPGGSLKGRDAVYEKLLKYLDIDAQMPKARIAALREAPVERLVQAVIDFKAAPMWPYASDEDPFYFNGPPRWSTVGEQLRNCQWCKEVIIGDSSFEGFMVVSSLLQSGNRQGFLDALRTLLKDADAEMLRKSYDIHPTLPSNLFWTNTARLVGDMAFSEPTARVAHALSSSANHRIYRYQVCLSNPFPGSMFSYVAGHHFVEILYLFMTYLERYPTHRNNFFAEVAKALARKWIGFANGKAPWAEFREENGWKIAVFDDLRGIDVRSKEQDERIGKEDVWGERRYEGWEMIRQALENAEDGDAARGAILTALL